MKTEALPSGTRLTPGSPTEVTASDELKWRITVEHGGDFGENGVVEGTREVYPGLIITGMACAQFFGTPRMGPIFGGMLLSGKKAASLVAQEARIATCGDP